jgi:uncharacterized membrane protein
MFRNGPFQPHDGFHVFGFIFLLIIVLGLIFLAASLWRGRLGHGHAHPGHHPHDDGHGPGPGPRTPALQILEERFAKGEINADEFKTARDTLLNKP